MKTVLTTDHIEAAAFVRKGSIVAFPTETVYGLGANAFDESAIKKIFEAKQRPSDNPLIAHISGVEQIDLLAAEVTESARKFVDAFFPGPLTIVVKKLPKIPAIATAGLGTIGVRMPRSKLAHQLLLSCETPVVAPSANLSGRPSPTTWQAVAEDLDGRIDCILQGDPTEIGLESTVVDCTSSVPIVLRSGAVSLEQLREIVPVTRVFNLPESEVPRSPGVRHKHYSPRAKVVVTGDNIASEQTSNAAYIGLNRPTTHLAHMRICSTIEDYARSIFEFFRDCDRSGIDTIFCERVDEKGIGVALMDRIRRAAQK